jgi:transcriptional regulator with XRE-family HTH domain
MPRVRKPACLEREENITKTLQRALLDKGWSVGHLAKLCGKNISHISRVIHNPLNVTVSSLVLIADKLGIKEIPL